MAKSFSLEEALGGASSPAAKPSKKFSLDDALGVAPPKPADSATALQMPEGDDYGTSFLGAEDKPKPKVYTGSVFDTEPFDPQFNPAEAERLSRRDYAEKGAQPPRRVQSMRATPADQIERTAGQAVADTAIGLLQGAAGIPKGIAANINAGDNPVAEFYEKAIQAGERAKSPYLQSQKAEREALLKNVLSNQGELAQTRAAFTSMFSPAGADVVSQGAGSMLPVVGMSLLGLGQKAFVATNALANAGEAAQNTARELAQMSPQEWSKSEAYQELRASGLSHADSVRMLAPLMAMPAQLTGGVVGGISGATGLEKSLAGKGIKGGARERVARAGSELLGEEAETLAPSLAGNITQRLIDEQKSLTEGLGREAVETAFGATPGMALAATGRSTPDVQKEIDTRGLADRMARERGFLVPETRAERQTPTERPAPVRERVEPTFDEEAFIPAAPKATEDLTQQRAQEQADVLELEARREPKPSSIIQNASMMQAHPDYEQEILAPVREAIAQNNYSPVVLKDGTKVSLVVSQNEDNSEGRVIAIDNNGQEVGQLMFSKAEDEDGNRFNPHAFVGDSMRRKGLATAMYDLAEASGAKIPSLEQRGQIRSDEGESFRRARAGLKQPATEETAQERLKRLSSKSIGMTNAFRDNIITNQEYDKFKSDLEAARQAVEQEAPDLSALSPAKREILEIADKLEAAGVKGFPRGMRSNARPEAREPDEKTMEFYRSKLQPYEEKPAVVEKKTYGLPEFFSDSEKEVARITSLMKSGPLKTRVALSEANDSIQRLADTIQAAGFDINNLVPGQVPDGIMKIKSQIGNIAARSNRLAAAAEAVQKKYKRADPARVKTDAAELMSDVEEADNLIAEDQNLPPLAEQMEGVAPPVSPEVEELLTKQRLANEDIRILSNRTAGTSLMKVLEGSLLDSEMSELAGKARKIGKNPFISLVAKKGKRGSSMEDMVNSGKLDLFLPFAMRPGQPSYDNGEAAEYIREKLRTGEFYTDDIRNEIENIQRGIWDIEKQIEEELSLEDINREIQYAVDEQRALDQETAEPATEGAPEAPESSTGEEELLKAQTKEELKAKQDEIDRLSKENERLAKEAERRAKADEEAGDFVLTGSNRVADQAAARGQMELTESEDAGTDFEDNKSALTKLAEKLLSKGTEQYEETELDGKLYQVRTRTFNGKLFGSELQLVKDTVGLARDVNLINEEDRVMTLQLTGKNVGEGRNVRIMDSQYTEQSGLDAAEPEGITVVSDTKGKDDYGNAVSNIELSNGNKYQLIRLNSTESMGLPGWHDANKFGPTDGGFLGNTKAEAIGELIERETQKKGGQTFRNITPPKAPSTDSAAFKKWFGDSKVVDENGKPLVVYHGTGADITAFDADNPRMKSGKLGKGIYLTPSAQKANFFAKLREKDGAPNVMPLYASLKNPLEIYGENNRPVSGMDRDTLQSNGYDGVILYDEAGVMQEVVAFSPTQIKSATGNVGTYDPENANILFDVRTSPVTGEPIKRAPSVTRRAKTLSRANSAGKISDMEFVIGVNAAIEAAEAAKMAKDRPERQRGADFIRQKLLEAKRRGDLSEEASDLAEWFILQNPALVDDLGISIRMKKAEGTAGQYIPFSRIMVLMKESANDQTPVHEILHHLERMMPADMQSAIRKEWAKQLTQAKQKAATPDERKFFELLFRHHYHENGSKNDFDKAVELIQDGKVPYESYQYVNPSEFWAVNGSDIMQGRFDAVRGGVLQRMKSWLKELGQKFKSIFGMPSSAPLLRALDSLSKGDGQFVTKEMLGDAAGYAAIAGKNVLDRKPMANWTMPDSTNLDSFIYFMQNKQIDMKRAVEAIQQNVQTIDERFNPYMKETLFQGRAATQTKRFLQNELEPLFKEMGRLNVTMPELEEYLHNRHAQERNEQIASVNPGMPDEGSGIETADAQNYLANLSPDQEAKYKKLAGMVDAITAGTRQLLVDSGLESQETIDKWEETYDNYVPLNRDDIDYSSNHGMGVGQGYSVRGSASKRAVGSKRKVVDILANIAMQRERNIVRAEKNRVAMALYGLAIQNPNPDIFLAVNPDAKKDIPAATQELVNMGFLPSDINGLMKEPSTLEIDPQTGLAIERIHQMQRGADNVMGLRVNGENRYVFFNQNNERAKRMAMAIKNLDADKLGLIMSTTADITRFLAAMNTQYNPLFGAYNFLRDVSTAGLQLTDTPLAGKQKQVLNPKSVIGAMHGIYTDLRAERKGGAGTSQWSKLWEEFQQRGGQTGFRDQFSSTAKRGEALQRIVDPSSWADSGLGKVFTANGTLKVPMEAARKAAAPIFNWLSDYNEMMENAIRLSAYKTALDNGMSKDAAAVLAKELTVNFNRKGQLATQAGALYAFFNASVQGTTALIRTLSGPAGKAIIGGGLMLGAIQALLYSVAGFDEKEPKEFIREKNFVMPIGNGKYLAIPLPLGYNVIPNTSRLITEAAIRFAQGKKVKPTETAFKIFESLLGAFNPIGNAGWSFQTAAPTVADPFVAIMENKDWTGKRIAREDFNSLDPTPGFTRYKESASTFSRGLAEFMNSISGGTKDAPGRISPTPDQIDYFISQVFGGVGREALKIERTIRSQFTGEELPPQAIPLAGRFYGDTKGSSAVSSAFYENLKQMNIHENTIKGMRKRKENVQEYFRENPEARMFDEAGRVEREVQALRKRRRELVEKSAPKESVRAIEARITARMKRFNDRVEQREAKRN